MSSQSYSSSLRQQLGSAPSRAAASQLTTDPAAPSLTLSHLLAKERIIRFNVNLALITGDAKATLFMSQLLYWTQHGSDVIQNGGWIFKTREQWEEETGLSRCEQERARDVLLQMAIMEEARVGSPARNCYRINPAALGKYLSLALKSELKQLTLLDLRTPANETQVLIGRHFAYYLAFAKLTESITNAVMLSKLMQLQKNVSKVQSERLKARGVIGDSIPWDQDWFRLASDQIERETGLSAAQQKRSKKSLEAQNLLEEAKDHKGYPFVRIKVKPLLTKVKDQLLESPLSKQKSASEAATAPVTNQNYTNLAKSVPGTDYTNLEQLASEAPKHHQNTPVLGQFSPADKNQPSSSDQRAEPVGEFLHPSRRVFTPQMAGFYTPSRRLFAPPMRARTVLDYKDRNTTTTTLSSTSTYPQLDQNSPSEVVVVSSKKISSSPASFAPQNQPGSTSEQVTPDVLVPLVWSEKLDNLQIQGCQKLLNSLNVPFERRQLLVDELSGFLGTGKITNPVAYFSKLIRLDMSEAGGLVFTHAHEVARVRQARIDHEERQKASIQAAHAGVVKPAISASLGAQAPEEAVVPMPSHLRDLAALLRQQVASKQQEKTGRGRRRSLDAPQAASVSNTPKKNLSDF